MRCLVVHNQISTTGAEMDIVLNIDVDLVTAAVLLVAAILKNGERCIFRITA
jgi:hypothetical protein